MQEWRDGEGVLHCGGKGDFFGHGAPVEEEVPARTMGLLAGYRLAGVVFGCAIADDAGFVY